MVIAFVATVGLTLLLFFTGLFVVFTPLPVAFTVLRKGVWTALLACATAMGALVLLYQMPKEPISFLPMMVFSPSVSLLGVMGLSGVYFFYYLWIGWVIAFASRRTGRWASIESSFALMTLAGLAVPAAALAVFALTTRMDVFGDLSRGVQSLFQRMIDLQQAAGMGEEDLAFLRASAPLVVSKFLQILPSLWIDLTLIVLSLNILFLRRWVLSERPFPQWPDFSLWRLPEVWIWAPIAGGAVYFLNTYLVGSPALGILAVNVLIVVVAICFFQGMAVGSFFFKTRLSPLLRLMGYALFFLFFQVGAVLVMGVGLADFWFDFRKLKKVG